MKYTTKIKQRQRIGKIRIDPKGGDLNTEQVKEIQSNPWGVELLKKGIITIEGVNPANPGVTEEKKEAAPVQASLTADTKEK